MKYLTLLVVCCCFACQSSESTDSKAIPTLLPEEKMRADDEQVPPQHEFLTAIFMADSLALMPGQEESPMAFYEVSSFEANFENDQLNAIINTALGRAIVGEDAPMRVTDLRRTIQAFVKSRIKAYGQQEIEPDLVKDMPSAYEQDHRFTTAVTHQNDRILTLATNHYYFTGGAHGNYYTVLQSFDLKEAKEIHFTDLFRPDAKDQLTEVLSQWSEFKSEDIYPTENVGFTAEGLLFNYPPYEIGSYADGEIEIVLPYDVARDYLSDNARRLLGI